MRLVRSFASIGVFLALACSQARAGDANCPPPVRMDYPKIIPCPTPPTPGTPETPVTPAPVTPPGPAPAMDGLASAARPEAGPGDLGSFNPQMFGDLIGISARRQVTIQGVTRTILAPIPTAAAFKISDNESPRPTDRIFFTYNYFDGVNKAIYPNVQINLHRELMGFEKTLLGGNMSVGMRLPYIQLTGTTGVEDNLVGDLSVILKYALINDRSSGNVLSGGLVVTAPTGRDFVDASGNKINPTIIQPFAGYILNLSDACYVHGFLSLDVTTDQRDVVLLANDVGVGYWLRRNDHDGWINSIVPTIEAHVNTPLNHRGSQSSPIGVPDTFNFTGGVHVILQNGWTISSAVGVPWTGPTPNTIEGILQLNIQF
jgi:hypothetical protein